MEILTVRDMESNTYEVIYHDEEKRLRPNELGCVDKLGCVVITHCFILNGEEKTVVNRNII